MQTDVFETSISEEVYSQNYQYGDDQTVDDTWRRNARKLASIEDDPDRWEQLFYEMLSGQGLGTGPFPFTPGGRIFANAGTGLGKASMINCFVSGAQGTDIDSMDEIQNELYRQAKILASEGGYGFCASWMRPRGARIGGVGSMTPGAVKMLDIWNEQAATIVAGSGMKSDRDDVKDKIRKGAQMVTMHMWHPDVIEFIKAKQEPGRLHKFNMSLMVSDQFMNAVRQDKQWALKYPDFEGEPEFYREHWNGNLQDYKEAGGTVNIWRNPDTGEKAIYDAREIWRLVMESTYNRNEPGVLFYDTINKENNLNYAEHIDATNPCFTGDTLISTADGLVPAALLAEMDSQNIVIDGRLSEQTLHPTTEQGVYKTGEKMTYELVTKEGYQLSVTADHKIRTPNGWVQTQNLSEGDKIHIQNRKGGFGNGGSLEEGRVLGWLVGDGFLNHEVQWAVLSFFEEDRQIAQQMADAVNEVVRPAANNREYEITAIEIPRSDPDKASETRVRSKRLYELVEDDGLLDEKHQVPDRIMRGSEEMARGYLQALFSADGGVQGNAANGSSVRLSSVSKGLLKDVQRLLLNFGVYSTLYTDRKPEGTKMLPDGQGDTKEYDVQAFHDLVVSKDDLIRFRDQIGFLIDYKSERLNELLDSYTKGPYSRKFTATVSEIRERGVEPVYDLTEPDTHSLIGNGIVIHNCGEQLLPPGGVCLLGNLNLTQFINDDFDDFRYGLVETVVQRAVRFLDNVNDLTYVPTERQQRNLQEKRRIGLGHFGDGSALMMMKKRYGSDEAFDIMRQFQEKLANFAYQASAQLAKEKEPFPLYDRDYYLNEAPVVQRLSKKTREMIAAHGLRNSHLLSIQPTGNTSTLANAPSSGIEPVFMHSYTRTSEQPALPDELDYPFHVDFDGLVEGDKIGAVSEKKSGQDMAPNTVWKAEEQGDETVLRCDKDGFRQWQIHPTRGIVKDDVVEDYAVRRLKERGEWDPDADWAVTTRDLNVDDHLNAMKALAPFICSAMSKTINVPQDYPFEDFKEIYRKAHQTGIIKGVTTYRAGTMSAVLSDTDEGAGDDGIPRTDAPERPEELDCTIYRVRYSGDSWKIFVGYLDGEPYEVFARMASYPRLTDKDGKAIEGGTIRKVDSGKYQLLAHDGKVVIEDIADNMPDDTVREETRLISTALRHGTPLKYIVKQLEKAEGSIASFGRAMAKALKQEVDDMEITCDSCGSANVKHVEGCLTCQECGHSKCS